MGGVELAAIEPDRAVAQSEDRAGGVEKGGGDLSIESGCHPVGLGPDERASTS